MATGYATVNLGFVAAKPEKKNTFMDHLLKVEAWLDRRRTSRILYTLTDRDLADLGLSHADVDGLNEEAERLF
ncbi:DUF1127 domain-containing protein [Microvirga guangxiensis]|uniref:Uncharacterized conserved protein YjiS, DUF1127 family n=1 Tax=Microvirga guangxiensis TaxID=549386 RepID=A0A1G5G4M7_9HYPH|nr:DUF1127 domain-containing protein [Microvirga guangxiensis]SCY46210.1 Uncharacterized conserved protein YjiS, DUF1127 family [Microvirga guangxiensis]